MGAIGAVLCLVAFCVFLTTAVLLPFYIWRTWCGFAAWLAYLLVSILAFGVIAIELLDGPSGAMVQQGESPLRGVIASGLSLVGIVLSVQLLRGEIRHSREAQSASGQHPWFGQQPPV